MRGSESTINFVNVLRSLVLRAAMNNVHKVKAGLSLWHIGEWNLKRIFITVFLQIFEFWATSCSGEKAKRNTIFPKKSVFNLELLDLKVIRASF